MASGPARQVTAARARGSAPCPGQVLALDDPARPQQHRGRGAFGQAHQVHAEMHAVGEVHIRVPGRAEHHGVARRLATVGVGRGVGLPVVRLHLGQGHGDQALRGVVLEHAAQQGGRHRNRTASERVPRQYHGRGLPSHAGSSWAGISHRTIGHDAIWTWQQDLHTPRRIVDPVAVPV